MDIPVYSPREIVSELDRFIIGQDDAKRAVAIALRNRWRRLQLPEEMREEVVPRVLVDELDRQPVLRIGAAIEILNEELFAAKVFQDALIKCVENVGRRRNVH